MINRLSFFARAVVFVFGLFQILSVLAMGLNYIQFFMAPGSFMFLLKMAVGLTVGIVCCMADFRSQNEE